MPHDFRRQRRLQIMRPTLEVEIELKVWLDADVDGAALSSAGFRLVWSIVARTLIFE